MEFLTEQITPEQVPGGAYGAAWKSAFLLTGHFGRIQPDGWQYMFTFSTNSWYRQARRAS